MPEEITIPTGEYRIEVDVNTGVRWADDWTPCKFSDLLRAACRSKRSEAKGEAYAAWALSTGKPIYFRNLRYRAVRLPEGGVS